MSNPCWEWIFHSLVQRLFDLLNHVCLDPISLSRIDAGRLDGHWVALLAQARNFISRASIITFGVRTEAMRMQHKGSWSHSSAHLAQQLPGNR